MTDNLADTPAAWVGCLGCYNAGKLIGRWLTGPNSYIDWERAARDLFMDGYWSAPATEGGVHVFRY